MLFHLFLLERCSNCKLTEQNIIYNPALSSTLLDHLEYLVQSNDNADSVPPEDRFKYIDDLSLLQLVCLSGLLIDYNVYQHVPSDIGIDDQYLPPESYPTQNTLNTVANWTQQNLMQMNEAKCNYMSFSRSPSKFAARLSINNVLLGKKPQ